MPLLNPHQINNVLQELKPIRSAASKNELGEILEDNGLGKIEVLDTLASLMRGADTSAVRLQSAKTALQMHGMLSDSDKPIGTVVNIIIKDNEFSLNPILIPR